MLVFGCFLVASAATAQAFTLNDAYYTNTSLDISQHTSNARGSSWRADGSTLYIVGRGSANVVAYNLTQPWDLSTASFSQQLDISAQMGSAAQTSNRTHGLFLHEGGTQMWVFNRIEIWQYTLSTPWDITTATSTAYADYSAFVLRGHDIDFKPDGTQLYIDDRNGQAVHAVNLSTPWDITTSTWEATLDISAQQEEVRGIKLIKNGTVMLLVDTARKEVLHYDLSIPYNILSAEYIGAFDVSGQTNEPCGLSVDASENYFYITGTDKQAIYQYAVSEPSDPVLLAAYSVMTHGAAGDFAVVIDLGESYAIEPRAGTQHRLEFVFDQEIDITGASVTLSSGSVADLTLASTTVTDDTLVATLAEQPDNNACLHIGVSGVTDTTGACLMVPVTLYLTMILGEVDGSPPVNLTDLSIVRAELYQPVTGDNFMSDVNADGVINLTDLSLVRDNLYQQAVCP